MLTPFGTATDAARGSARGSAQPSVPGSPRTSARSPVALLRLVAWLVSLGAGVALLHGLGAGTLEAPPHLPSGWASWWTGSDPVVATMALLRLVVLGLGWYLLIATLLGLIAHVVRSAMLWRLAELVTARSMRELVAGLVGVALVSATSTPASAAPTLRSNEVSTPIPIQLVLHDAEDRDGELALGADAVGATGEAVDEGHVGPLGEGGNVGDVGGGTVPTDQGDLRDPTGEMVPSDQGDHRDPTGEAVPSDQGDLRDPTGETVPSDQGDPREPTGATTLGEGKADLREEGDLARFRQRGGPLRGSEVPRPDVGAGIAADPPTVPGALSDTPPGDGEASPTIGRALDEHIVEAGESFWVIASDVLAQAGEPTNDGTVERYWRVLIEANHDRLVVEGNPDLILPGQRLRVPLPVAVTSPGVAP